MDSLGKLVAGLLTSAQGDAAKTDRQEAAHNQDPWLGDLRSAAAAVMVATFPFTVPITFFLIKAPTSAFTI